MEMDKEILRRACRVEVIYHLVPESAETRPVALAASNVPSEFDFDEIPSRLFDGLFFLPSRLTVRYGDVVSQKCLPQQFQLLWYLERFDGLANLENAAKECLGKRKKTGEEITSESVKRGFYRLGEIFLELGLNATISVTSESATVNR